jgi:dTMP kinase
MNARGMLVSIDGPGGSGKSTITALVSQQLSARDLHPWATAEPSSTALGELIRASTDIYHGIALACLVAGDRHHHLAAEIRPRLRDGAVVICDRCLPSSFVLQRMDDVSWDVIGQLNAGTEPPDVAVILNADPPVLRQRMELRGGTHSRFERAPDGPAIEHALYQDTAGRLRAEGWQICEIDTTNRTAASSAAIVAARILTMHAERSAHDSQQPVIADILISATRLNSVPNDNWSGSPAGPSMSSSSPRRKPAPAAASWPVPSHRPGGTSASRCPSPEGTAS